MRQIAVTKVRTKSPRLRRQALLEALPLDPRDPDVVRAKEVQRGRAADPAQDAPNR